MFKNFTLIVLAFIFTALINSCTKDPASSVNPGGTSIYSFDGTPGSCAAPVVAGIYSVGRTLDASNTLTFTVNVTVKGTYSMNTTTSNGVGFSGSGTFTTTGPQTIVLTGYGTPIRAGNFPFVPVTNNTCNFTVSFISGAPQAVFTYAGGTGACTAPAVNGVYANGVALGSGNYVDLAVNVTTPGAYTVSTNSANGISFSGSGAFTATGAQVIRLIGNGTPAGQGTFAYTPSGGCSFSITVAPPPPPASFTYTCTPATISGTFAAGTALTSASTIKLDVNVTVAGTYSVTTTSSNGVTFSGSGVFSGIGAKTITLTSTNTPAAAGTFTYTPTGAGCSFDVTYTGGGGGGGGDFIKCTIDGVFIDFSTAVSATLLPGTFSAGGDNSTGSKTFDLNVTDIGGGTITTGTYNKLSPTNFNKFCDPTYTPDNGSPIDYWSPDPLNSNPFVITITSITANKVIGTFSGDLFDTNGANKKIVSGGTFSVTY
jgi:hypothetical protein